MSLPEPNPFLTTDFDLVENVSGKQGVVLLESTDVHKLWHKLDGKDGIFSLPKVCHCSRAGS